MKNALSLFLSVLLIFTTACTAQGPEADFAFIHVNVITMENEVVLKDQTVLIKDGKILKLGGIDDVKSSGAATVIDGTGKYLMPGISEMHAHIPGDRNGTEIVEETLFLYLSNGITLIRGMLGQPYHLTLREQVASGEVLGPRIYTSGPSINGNTVRSVEEAQTKVTAQKEAGYDFLKLHPGLTRENFDAVVATANKVGIPYAGHVSTGVGVRRAIEAKYGSIDHVDGYVEGLVPSSIRVNPNTNGFFGVNFTDIADENLIPELVAATKEAGVWIVPTQAMMERWIGPTPAAEIGADPEMQYINPRTLNNWISTKNNILANSTYDAEQANKFNALRRKVIGDLHKAGVGILLGSDAPQVFNVPGFSIQREMDAMLRSGMSEFEILKSGTVNPAIYFGDEDKYGMVKEGLSADLILLDANPLSNIANMKNPAGVMVKGNWLDADLIARRLKVIADKY
ncbi:MAG: amidohydrolase family protein [Roseivirga sp.]|nr:amidohydrolase family protein [Roseivirga sp.]